MADELEGLGLNVITRSGSPAKPTDQHRVAAASADTVVVLWPGEMSSSEASAHTAAALSALRASGGVRGQKVVVQSRADVLEEFDAAQVCLSCNVSSAQCRAGLRLSLTSSGVLRLRSGAFEHNSSCNHLGI